MYRIKETLAVLSRRAMMPTGAEAVFKVHYWGLDPQLLDNPVHKHSFFEVCYVLDGEGEYTDDGTDFPLRRGTHFCSRPGITHQIRSNSGLYLLFVAFELDERQSSEAMREAFHILAEKGGVWVPNGDHTSTALLWKSLLLQEEDSGNLPPAAVSSAACGLLLSFLGLFGTNEKKPHATRQNANIIMQQSKLYIRDNLSRPLSLQDVARYLNVSERHLSRLFSAGIHENFTTYIRDERIRQASLLLAKSDLSIKEIAEATGFSSVHYFSRIFTKAKHLPPGKFRARALE